MKKLLNVNAKKVKANFTDEVSRAKMVDFADSINLNGPQGHPYTGRSVPALGETRGETFVDKLKYSAEIVGLKKPDNAKEVVENVDDGFVDKACEVVKGVAKKLWDMLDEF